MKEMEPRVDQTTYYTVYSWSPYGHESHYDMLFTTLDEAKEFASKITDALVVITEEVEITRKTEIIVKDEGGYYRNA